MPTREVLQGDGLAWLRQQQLTETHALVTSLPDVSELPQLGFDGWRSWFIETSALVCERSHERGVSVFFQTDIKREGAWVDKAYLVQRGAEQAGVTLLWHKVVCRKPPGTTSFGRPAFAHVLCFSRLMRLPSSASSPDVLPSLGQMPWSRAMGVEVCDFVCRFLQAHTSTRTVVDPFCGQGTVLAVANRHGLDAVGVELSRKRAKRARNLQLDDWAAGAQRPSI
ncbi:MAG: SAM-dependent methyltransferase [Myxococcales bacterium]|nr:SAM-dependent methyltransferase [Myxococcales bacterium]